MKSRSASQKNQWIQEPLRTQTFTEQIKALAGGEGKNNSTAADKQQVIGGVSFQTFNFDKNDE